MTDDNPTDAGEDPANVFTRIGNRLTRRSFMGNSAKAGGGALMLSMAGSGAASAAGDEDEHEDGESEEDDDDENGETAADGGPTDVEILNFALTLEQLEYEFYREGLEAFGDDEIAHSNAADRVAGDDPAASIRGRFEDIRDHEKAHVDVITAVIEQLGGEPVSGLSFEFPYETFDEFVGLAATFEPLGVDAYAGAAIFIDTKLLIPTALSIHSVEANHAAYLRDLNGGDPAPVAFNTPAAMDSVVALASQFIVGLNDDRQRFAVTIENVSDENTLQTSEGSQSVTLSPGAYAVHDGGNPFYTPHEEASEGLERLAEDGFPLALVPDMEESLLGELAENEAVVESGPFHSLEGGLPPLGPGESTTFYITAGGDEDLSLVTMVAETNDAFLGPDLTGDYDIELMRDGELFADEYGDVTDQIELYDAGTEENQEPGVGPDVKTNQSPVAVDAGPEEDDVVRPMGDVDDGYDYPAVSDVISVTVEPL